MALTREKFYIVVPKAATNLVTNPSLETGITGWVLYGAGTSIAITTEHQSRGAKGLAITPGTGVAAGTVYSVALTSGIEYTFSIDVLDIAGQSFGVYFLTSGYAIKASTTWTGDSTLKRKSITWTADASANFFLAITRQPVASTTPFYVDGAQLETGAESTYFDGDYWGQTLQRDYGWNGTRQASTSYRLARTRAGGTLLDIDTYAKVLGHIGLGRAPEQHFTSEINADGELYQATKVMPRDFVINLVFSGSTSEVATKRKALLAALQLDKTPIRQPIVLRYQGVDANGEWMTAPVNIPCVYMGGLEKSATTYGVEKCAVQFRMTSPYMEMDGEVGNALGYSTSVSNFANIGYRDTDGTWKAMSTGVNGTVYCMVQGPDGSIYIGGAFTLAGGVANTAYIAKWTGSAFVALGTGMNGTVRALAFDAAGNLYAGGDFTLAGGVANTVRIAKWTGTAWVALSTGIGSGGVYAIAIGPTGIVYIGGTFTNHVDANGDYITKWSGSAFSSMSTGLPSTGRAIIIDGDTIYAAASTSGVYKWSGTAWVNIASGLQYSQIDPGYYCLALGPDKSLYLGGKLGNYTSLDYSNVKKYNGTIWSDVGGAFDSEVNALIVSNIGELYAGGNFTIAGDITMPDRMSVWRGGAWQPMDVNVNDVAASIQSILTTNNDRIYVGGIWTGSTATSATTTVSNNTGTKAYPQIEIYGPGSVWQIKNYTNGAALYFNNLTLLTGESIFIDCNPFRFRIISSWRGDIQNYVLPGSTNITLEPGNNNVSAYLMGSGAGSSINLTWKPTYSSIDEALR